MTWADFFKQLLPTVAGLASVPIAAIVCAILWRIAAWVGYKATDQQKDVLERDIITVLKFGAAKVLPLIAQHGYDSPIVRNAVLVEATSYLKERFPDQAAKIESAGVNSPEPIHDTLDARVTEVLQQVANSPATPAPTNIVPRS